MTERKTVSLTIDGRAVRAPEGTSILEAAKLVDIAVPHYCYHPGLPVAGVCRMCLVEVERMPKLAPACATSVMEGQVVHVHSSKALDARKGVLEFLLINHPLDCPICDQSGECKLQDYTFEEGRADSRYREPKRFSPVEDFGGDVLFVPNRCIVCTRCVRFMSDVAHDPVLNVSERGDRAYIGKADGHDLTNPWAGNVVDLCPVGALLSKDFLNKARAWELDHTPTVCTGCSQGCNAMVETRDNVVVRLKPRENTQVNQYYLCETGRSGYREFNRRDRIDQPKVRRDGVLHGAEWAGAISASVREIRQRRLVVLTSPSVSNEALFLLARLRDVVSGAGVYRVARGAEAPLPGAPDLALRAERAANVSGAQMMGFLETVDLADVLQDGDALLVIDDSLSGIDPMLLDRAATIVYAGTSLPHAMNARAATVLPLCNIMEEEGTLTNLRGRVQLFTQAKAAPGVARPSWSVLGDLLAGFNATPPYYHPADVFDGLAHWHSAFAGLSHATLGANGALVADAVALSGS
jgi:NADH-quinone oxidoreductase subunit G